LIDNYTLVSKLTPSELEVLCLMAEGMNNQAISDARITELTATKRHINFIFHKLCLNNDLSVSHSRVMAVLMYLKWKEASA